MNEVRSVRLPLNDRPYGLGMVEGSLRLPAMQQHVVAGMTYRKLARNYNKKQGKKTEHVYCSCGTKVQIHKYAYRRCAKCTRLGC